jgi:hypothetical protein
VAAFAVELGLFFLDGQAFFDGGGIGGMAAFAVFWTFIASPPRRRKIHTVP